MPRPPTSPSPPASFPFAAGSFDFPRASTSPPTASISRDTRSASSVLRALAGWPEHHEATSPRPPPPMPHQRMPRAAGHGPLYRLFGPPRDSDTTDTLSRRPPTANPSRPRATPSERYLRRSQARIREQRADMESAADLLDSPSDIPINNPFTLPNTNPRLRSPAVEVSRDRRQTKRRKLEHNAAPRPAYDGFKYGYKGQVVAGRLKMEIVSCDGGEYYEKDNPALYKVQNVLKNDKSVYCSESSRCNLLLKHIGEAPFALEKVVIRAPDRGFTAPVQEGLIFVSMSANELLASTSAYNLQYHARSPMLSPTPGSPDDDDDEQISLLEAIEDPRVWQHSRQGAQEEIEERIEHLRLRTARLNREAALRAERDRRRSQRRPAGIGDDAYSEHCDHVAEDSYAGLARVSAPTPPPFTVTTASEEEDSDSNEEPPSAAVMADRLRRESRWRAESDDNHDEDDDDDDIIPRLGALRRAPAFDYTYGEWRERRERYLEPIRASQVGAPSRIEPSEPPPEADTLIPPHARFFIAKNKSKITIKFHPAISGRNVLLKLWSPTHDGNIDIETVQFYGFSGPRFFPAMHPC